MSLWVDLHFHCPPCFHPWQRHWHLCQYPLPIQLTSLTCNMQFSCGCISWYIKTCSEMQFCRGLVQLGVLDERELDKHRLALGWVAYLMGQGCVNLLQMSWSAPAQQQQGVQTHWMHWTNHTAVCHQGIGWTAEVLLEQKYESSGFWLQAGTPSCPIKTWLVT